MAKKLLFYVFFIFIFFIVISGISVNILFKNIESDALNSFINFRYKQKILLNQKETYNLKLALKAFANSLKKEYYHKQEKRILDNFKNIEFLFEKDPKLLKDFLTFKNSSLIVFDKNLNILFANSSVYNKNLFKCNFKLCVKDLDNKRYFIKYLPQYKIYLVDYFPLKVSFVEIKELLKSFKDVVVVYKGKFIKGKFNKDSFYIMSYIKDLDLFIGKEVQYSQIYSVKKFFHKLSNKLKHKISFYLGIYLFAIVFIYFIFIYIYKRELDEIDNYINLVHNKALRDPLTKFYNRHALETLRDKVENKTLIVLDLDNFKYINDTFGHEKGDLILKDFSDLLRNYFSDDIIIRWGGDEFLIFTDKDYDEIVKDIYEMNQIILHIQYGFDNKLEKKLTVSAGVCEDKNLPYEEKFKNADLALYKVKKTQKGKVLKYKNINYIKIEKE